MLLFIKKKKKVKQVFTTIYKIPPYNFPQWGLPGKGVVISEGSLTCVFQYNSIPYGLFLSFLQSSLYLF